MTTANTAVTATPTAVATATAPTLQDMTTQQVSERLSALATRHDSLKAAVTEFDAVKVDLAATLAEFQKRLGVATPTAVATATAPTLQDMTTQQVSERLSALATRHDSLKAAVTEFDAVKVDLAATLAEFQKRLGVATPVAAKPAKESTPRAPRQKKEGEGKYPSLKEIVVSVLNKNADGLELKGIVAQVQAMIDNNEYASTAKSLSAVVSQAVNALKQESLINHDRESKKYSAPKAA